MGVAVETTTDVVIIGAGPSGLMAALWMARCGVDARIIDARATKVFRGHADALQTGTFDILESFGIADELYKNAAPAMDMTVWTGDGDTSLKRVARFPKWYPELGRYHLVHTSQGNTERALLDGIRAFRGLEVERGVVATGLDVDESTIHDSEAYPVRLTVQHLTDDELAASSAKETIPQPGDFNYTPADESYLKRKKTGKEGSREVINAKFVIGADGARSWTRQALGLDFVGEDGDDSVAGILDCVATSDFPDIRTQCMVSKNGYAAGFVPRENGLVRIAAPVSSRSGATPEAIVESMKNLLSPYKLDVTHVDWCGVFGTRRRTASHLSKYSRIFLAGDALHVHSPRGGIGMNFSMQDTYNLGWKIAHVVKGISPLALLETYDQERGLTTKQLIDFDKALSNDMPLGGGGFEFTAAQKTLHEGIPFSSTVAITYEAGLLVAKEGRPVASKQELAPGIIVGRRLPSRLVENHASGEPVDFGKSFPSDGRYRIVIFAGDISRSEQLRRVNQLSQVLELPEMFLRRSTKQPNRPWNVIEILVVHTANRDDVEIADLPQSLFKYCDPFTQVFVDNDQAKTWVQSDAYAKYGISRDEGCLVLVRPDGYVMYVGQMEDGPEMIKLMAPVLNL